MGLSGKPTLSERNLLYMQIMRFIIAKPTLSADNGFFPEKLKLSIRKPLFISDKPILFYYCMKVGVGNKWEIPETGSRLRFFVMSKNAFREEVWGQNAPKNEVNSVNCDKKVK